MTLRSGLVDFYDHTWQIVGRIGKNKTLISINIPNAWRVEIDRRAAVLSLTRSAYAAMILEKWVRDGMPHVSEPDRLMQLSSRSKAEPAGGGLPVLTVREKSPEPPDTSFT